MSQPAGAAVDGAVIGALAEKVTETLWKWARDYSYAENRRVKVNLYGPAC
jgi:hypothetical protein